MRKPNLVAVVAALVLGTAAGALGGWGGHWFEHNEILANVDPLVYGALRWTVILTPTALAAAVGAALASDLRKDIGQAMGGGVLGGIVAAMAYTLVNGFITTNEARHFILPASAENRWLIIASALVCIPATILIVLHQQGKAAKGADETTAASDTPSA